MAYKVAVIGGKSATDGMGYAAYFVIRTRLDLLSIPQSGGENVKSFRWGHGLQTLNIFMPFKRVPLIAHIRQYNIEEKPTVVLYTYIINRHAGTPEKQRNKNIVLIIVDHQTLY